MHWSFPWTMHLGITEFRAFADELDKFSTGPEEKDCVLKNVEHGGLTVDLERLNASRQALSKLCKDSRDFNHIATFALGGFVPLYYLASKQGGFDDSKKTKYHLHLFAGLAWAAKREIREQPFIDFIQSLGSEESLLVFDIGSVGHGIISAAKHIRTLLEDGQLVNRPRIHLLGFVDGTDPKQTTAREALAKQCAASKVGNIDVVFVMVDLRNMDDACHLQGYIQMRKDAQLQPYKNMGSVTVVDGEGKAICGVGTADSAGVFLRLVVEGVQYFERMRKLGTDDRRFIRLSTGCVYILAFFVVLLLLVLISLLS